MDWGSFIYAYVSVMITKKRRPSIWEEAKDKGGIGAIGERKGKGEMTSLYFDFKRLKKIWKIRNGVIWSDLYFRRFSLGLVHRMD